MIRITSRPLGLIVIVVFVAGIGLTMAFNLWHTTTTKEPAKYGSGEYAGQANPADIRGSYAFADVASAFGVPLADLAKAFGLEGESDPGAVQVKTLETKYADLAGEHEIGTDSVRLFVARYKGLPITAEAGTGLPAAAAELLLAKAALSPELVADLRSRVVEVPREGAQESPTQPAPASPAAPAQAAPAQAEPGQPSSATHVESADDRSVKGNTTFKNLADWGVSKEDLEKVFGAAIGAPGTTVRDYCTAKGIEFSTVKDKVQALVDAKR